MIKTTSVRARIEPGLKHNVESVFHSLGLTTTQAITLFFKQVELRQGLPFDVALPNAVTRQTFDDTDDGQHLTECSDADDMFQKLGI